MSDKILENLTNAQRQAVRHREGPLLVLAGPGSGKTRVVTHRMAYLVAQGVPPWQILGLTFTNKAADEMQRRVERLAGGQRVWISTFHRFGARMLRQHAPLIGLAENYSIYDTESSLGVVKQAMQATNTSGRYLTPERMLRAISNAKGSLLTPEQLYQAASHGDDRQTAIVYRKYQELLLSANAADFDDLLVHVVQLLRENPELRSSLDERYSYVMVDEYQDTNSAQYALVRALSIDSRNLAVTGDPDQSIYGWRGANVNNILNFERDYPDAAVVRLEQNFRSTQRIVRVAAHLIEFNAKRKRKSLYSENQEGDRLKQICYVSQYDEADDIAQQIAERVRSGANKPSDFAVFYRVNALSRAIEHALRRHVVPYQVVRGLEFYQRREIKDLLAYLQLINNPRDDAALRRVVNVPPRGIGRKTVERLEQYGAQRRLSLLQSAQDSGFLKTIGPRPAAALQAFTRLQTELQQFGDRPVEEILGQVIAKTGYDEFISAESSDADVDRGANVQELLNEAREFDTDLGQGPWLEAFLERAALVADVDQWEAEASKVSLMTLHAAKGLEFPHVFIIGLEEGLLPHERTGRNQEAIEEERRLLFVGITRAKERLQLSHADMRLRGGGYTKTVASSFLFELPLEDVERTGYASDKTHPQDDIEIYVDHEDFTDVAKLPPPAARSARAQQPLAMTTAAQLLKDQKQSKDLGIARPAMHSVDEFSQGMLVQHPEYGMGLIVALSGSGNKRTATVRFLQGNEDERRFVLAFSGLVPAGSQDSES